MHSEEDIKKAKKRVKLKKGFYAHLQKCLHIVCMYISICVPLL